MSDPDVHHALSGASIAYFLHGRGRGHASRSRPIVERLRDHGANVRVFAGGDALDLLDGLAGVVPRDPVLPGLGLRTLPARLREDGADVRRADLVISDGDMPSLIAARRLGVPSLAVGHDLVFTRCRLPKGLDRRHLLYQHINTFSSARLTAWGVAVHFLPAHGLASTVRVARPDPDFGGDGEVGDDGFLLAYFRDGNGGPVLEALAADGRDVRCYGRLDDVPASIDHRGFDGPGFRAALRRCSGVVCSAGSNLLSESVLLGKPMLAMHKALDAEQALNAQLAADAGVAVAAAFEADPSEPATIFLRKLDARAFAVVPLAELLAPVTDVVAETAAEMLSA